MARATGRGTDLTIRDRPRLTGERGRYDRRLPKRLRRLRCLTEYSAVSDTEGALQRPRGSAVGSLPSSSQVQT